MLRECCSLMLLCGWNWRAGLSSSLCWRQTDKGRLVLGWFSVFKRIFHPFRPGLRQTKVVMMSWSLHAVVQPVKQDKSAQRGGKKVIGGMTESVESLPVWSHGSAFHGSVYQQHDYILYLLFVPHLTALRLPSASPVNINPSFFLFTLLSWFLFCFSSQKGIHMALTCQPPNEPITVLKLSQMHEVHSYPQRCYLCCTSKRQANCVLGPADPVPTHQRYHSDFSSSSESPSVTSSDPDYGHGRSAESNTYHRTWMQKQGCVRLY